MFTQTRATLALIAGILLVSVSPSIAQEEAAPQPFDITTHITDAVAILDYLEDKSLDIEPEDLFVNWDNSEVQTVLGAAMSPDASQLAWHGEIRENVTNESTDVLCIHTFESASTRCYLPSEDLLSFSPLKWSSDGRFITFTEDRIQEEHEPDVYVYDVAANVLLNLSDDGITGSNYDATQAQQDFNPTWNPFTGNLLFMRNTTPTGVAPTIELYRITPAQIITTVESVQAQINTLRQERSTGTEEDIVTRDMVNEVQVEMPAPELLNSIGSWPAGTTFNDTYRAMLHGPTEIDPGGVFMAVVTNNETNPTDAGIWLIDLNTYQPLRLLGMGDLTAFNPGWVQRTTLQNLAWTRDSSGLAISMRNSGDSAEFNTTVYFNLNAGILNPLVDYGELPEERDFFSGQVSFIQPNSGVLLPDNTFFYFNRSTRDTLNAVPVPPPAGGSSPLQVNLGRDLDQQNRLSSTVGFNDTQIRALLDLNLITLSR